MPRSAFSGILVYFHCEANTGYAIGRLERVFYRMAAELVGDPSRVFFAYPRVKPEEALSTLPADLGGVWELDPRTADRESLRQLSERIRDHKVNLAFGFDQPPGLPIYSTLRSAGVERIFSYWGAPMSSVNSWPKLLLKRLQNALLPGPDHYIFESRAMQRTATHGRGISKSRTSVVYLGVDTDEFRPGTLEARRKTRKEFGIPENGLLVFYSGHMEPRKGVHVLVQAICELVNHRSRDDIYCILLGNKGGEERSFEPLFAGTRAQAHIVFGGYRDDIAEVMQASDLGVIASTGWDSFTRSAVEMAATGLPLIVSRLQGLQETVEEGVTGELVAPGDHHGLADAIANLVDDPGRRASYGQNARKRVIERFSEGAQIQNLKKIIQTVHR